MKTWETKNAYRITQLLSGRSNVFLLTNGAKNILVDTSTKYMWHLLKKRLQQLNINHIDYLILTHSHFDHAANTCRIKEKYNARIIVHKDEASCLASGVNFIPQGTNLYTRTIVNLLAKLFGAKIKSEPCKPDILVETKLDLNDFGFNAYIMHTPGHSPGSMSIIVDNEVAVVGDAMVGVLRWTVFPPFADDVRLLINSWGRLLETNCTVFLPSHGSANKKPLVQKDYNKRKL